MSTRVGVVLFPGSNCEFDVIEAVRSLGGEAEILWHGEAATRGVDAVVVPPSVHASASFGDFVAEVDP